MICSGQIMRGWTEDRPGSTSCGSSACWMLSVPSQERYSCNAHLVRVTLDAMKAWQTTRVEFTLLDDHGFTAREVPEPEVHGGGTPDEIDLSEEADLKRIQHWQRRVMQAKYLGQDRLWVTPGEYRAIRDLSLREIERAYLRSLTATSSGWTPGAVPYQPPIEISFPVIVDTEMAAWQQRAYDEGYVPALLQERARYPMG